MLSTDRNVCRAESAVSTRLRSYAERLGEVHVIVFTTRAHACAPRAGRPLHVHPTRSSHALWWGVGAIRIAFSIAKPAVVTAQDPFETGLIGWVIACLRGAPLHIQVHTDFTAQAFRRGSFINRIRALLAWFVLGRASRIRVVLEKTAEDLKKRGVVAPVTILPIFTDIEKSAALPRLKHPRFKIALLFIGRLEKEKRADRAIEALKAARDAGHDAGLAIIGSGREEAMLRALVSELHLGRYVEFVGWQDDLTPHLAHADIVLVPSEYEGYGMVIIEALAAGVPVLATDVGVAREAGAIVVAPKDFSASLVRWIGNGPRQASLMNYPYRDFDEYVSRLTADIAASAR